MAVPGNRVLLDPMSPAYDTADQAAKGLTDGFAGMTDGLERAGAVVLGNDGKYRYTSSTGGTNDNFNMRVALPKTAKIAALVHTHPGMDDLGQVFSPNDLTQASTLNVPSYVKFAKDGSMRKYTPGTSATRTIADPTNNHNRLKVADGDAVTYPTEDPSIQVAQR